MDRGLGIDTGARPPARDGAAAMGGKTQPAPDGTGVGGGKAQPTPGTRPPARDGAAAMGYFIMTMGCQMNERDSETIAGLLAEAGHAPAAGRDSAGIIIVNTCSVRDNADNRFFGVLGQIKKIKERNPALITAVCGCMMQQQHIVDAVKGKYPWVDIVFGTHNIHMFPQLLRNVIYENAKPVDVWAEGGEIVEGLPARREFPFKAYVNIMYGCDNYCTYCIVPYTRGRERSRRPSDIEREVRELAAGGVKEVMLLGQNVNSYAGIEAGPGDVAGSGDAAGVGSGAGFGDADGSGAVAGFGTAAGSGAVAGFGAGRRIDFPELLYMIDSIPGIERIRFMTSHPKDLSDRLIEAYKGCGSLCNVIHLPVQSGSSRVLKLMNRNYTKEGYLELIRRLREASPHIAVTTDFIVGFPGETEEDFEETMDLIDKVRFDSAFTFIYSVRRGTPAADFAGQVPEEDKHRRFNRLVERLNAIAAEKNSAYRGRIERVLVEGPAKTGEGMMAGRTDSGKLVNFKGLPEEAGEMLDVKITEAKTFSLLGEAIR